MATTEQIATRILLDARLKVMKDLVRRDRSIAKKYKTKIEKLQRQLRSGGNVSAKVTEAMGELAAEIEPDIAASIQTGSITGKQAARDTFKKVFGSRAKAAFPTDIEALAAAGERIRGRTTVDKVSLSKRLWRAHQRTGKQMSKAIQASLRSGGSLDDIADEILRVAKPQVTATEYATKMAAAARRGGDELVKVSAKYQKQLGKLGSAAGYGSGMRPVVQDFQAALTKARPEQIDRIVQRFVEDKAKAHAQMIARTETIEAYRDSYKESTSGQGWVKGYRWSLGASHPKLDECDILAGQDMYGLGPGGYPEDGLPDTPHPNDMCIQTAIIDKDHFKRKTAKLKGEKAPPEPWKSGKKETSEQWLRKQPTAAQKQILGPTKYEAFQQKVPVLGKNGIPKRVRDLPPITKSTRGRARDDGGFATKEEIREDFARSRRLAAERKARGEPVKAMSLEMRDARARAKIKHTDKREFILETDVIDPKLQRRITKQRGGGPALLVKGEKGFKPMPARTSGLRQSRKAVIRTEVEVTGKNKITTRPDVEHLRKGKGWLEPHPLPIRPSDPHAAKLLKRTRGKVKRLPHCEYNTGYKGPLKSGMNLREVEDTMKGLNREHFAAWDAEGNLIMRKTVNDAYQVRFTKGEQAFLDKHAVYATHNHPGGGTFSKGDMGFTPGYNIQEFRALASKPYKGPGHYADGKRAMPGDVYRLHYGATKRITGTKAWDLHLKVNRAYDRATGIQLSRRRAAMEGTLPSGQSGRINYDDALTEAWNEIGNEHGFRVKFFTDAVRSGRLPGHD